MRELLVIGVSGLMLTGCSTLGIGGNGFMGFGPGEPATQEVAQLDIDESNDFVCRRMKITSSNVRREICFSRRDMREREETSRTLVREIEGMNRGP